MSIFAAALASFRNDVSDDFRNFMRQCRSEFAGKDDGDAELLDWYRRTEAYIWELSAYHEHPGFNYSGMCEGIASRLKNEGVRSVLCLGDGIGDLTLALHRSGIPATYHDLAGSRTASYAAFRFWRQTGEQISQDLTTGFNPPISHEFFGPFDAVVSLDFLEHVPNVEAWTAFAHSALKPGGLFMAQNAFACGSGADGSMPMHLAVNDRFEKDWDPLLAGLGFVQESSNWYRKPA